MICKLRSTTTSLALAWQYDRQHRAYQDMTELTEMTGNSLCAILMTWKKGVEFLGPRDSQYSIKESDLVSSYPCFLKHLKCSAKNFYIWQLNMETQTNPAF